jgi:hypothetical protein
VVTAIVGPGWLARNSAGRADGMGIGSEGRSDPKALFPFLPFQIPACVSAQGLPIVLGMVTQPSDSGSLRRSGASSSDETSWDAAAGQIRPAQCGQIKLPS